MARRHGLRSRMVASGRKTFWLGGSVAETTLTTANSAAIITSLNAAALALRPFTVIRSRGYWSMESDQNAASESQQAHIGAIVVSDQAVAIGVTAVPTPVTDNQSSWIFFEGNSQRYQVVSAIGSIANKVPWINRIDSKSMRKVEEGQDLIIVAENSGTGDGATIVSFVRTLIKLH